MKKMFTLSALALLFAGLSVMIATSLINQEVYGRWGTVVRMEYAPERYWACIFLLLAMVAMVVFAMWKVWRDS